MRTILQALGDEIHYPLQEGFLMNRLMVRGIEPDAPISEELLTADAFWGAVADCLYSLIEAPNISEADISISLSDKTAILRRANQLYKQIGEEEKDIGEPIVTFGW